MFEAKLVDRAARLIAGCAARNERIATVESCTGGLLAALLTEIAGSSAVFERGFVTYSNAAKSALVGVAPGLIEAHGAVSESVARAMATGALVVAPVDIAVSITGIAGPGGGSADKPVGLVWFGGAARDGHLIGREKRFDDGGRTAIRLAAVEEALGILEVLSGQAGWPAPGDAKH